jgi:uncharacterized protein YqjF (DUF2071 family)
MKRTFLKAAWRKLVMANYVIDPLLLQPYLPYFTEPDFFNGKCYVSLVGFMFDNVRLKGMPVPFHTRFPEVNLRFYVKRQGGDDRRGVVFISEIVPKPAIAWVANTCYKEKYIATVMRNRLEIQGDELEVGYDWYHRNKWHGIQATANNQLQSIASNSKEEFIFEHYYGYSKVSDHITNEYEVAHPRWQTYPVTSYEVDCNFEALYGKDFAFLNEQQPASVFLAEGSDITIGHKLVLK